MVRPKPTTWSYRTRQEKNDGIEVDFDHFPKSFRRGIEHKAIWCFNEKGRTHRRRVRSKIYRFRNPHPKSVELHNAITVNNHFYVHRNCNSPSFCKLRPPILSHLWRSMNVNFDFCVLLMLLFIEFFFSPWRQCDNDGLRDNIKLHRLVFDLHSTATR